MKVETPPGLAVQYKWNLTDLKTNSVVLSKNISYQQNDSFRIGLKNPSPPSPSTLIFFTMNLNKIGLKATAVNYSSDNDLNVKQMDYNIGREEDENGALQMFTAPLQDDVVGNTSFLFTIYLNGILDNYRVRQIDGLLSEQLLKMNLYRADFELKAKENQIFLVQKWILAARCPFFAALLSKERPLKLASLNCTVNEMRLFLKFIYTGEFENPADDNFSMRLAAKFQINTLEKINQAASKDDFSVDKMATLAFHLLPGMHPLINAEISKPDSDLETITNNENISIINKITWKVDNWTKENPEFNIASSEAFKHEEIKCFRAELKTWKRIKNITLSREKFTASFLSFGQGDMSYSTEEVSISIGQDDSGSAAPEHKLYKMNEYPTHNEKLLQLFTLVQSSDSTNSFSFPFFVTFHVKMRSTVPILKNKIIDTHWSEELWAASVNRAMTDITLLVGETTFGAHRSLLCVRSPVFARMFSIEEEEYDEIIDVTMIEDIADQVRIENVDPITFRHFLKFLYTGTVEPSAINRELFTVADKYQVETLMELCQSGSQTEDVDEIFKTFLSC